MKIYLHICTKEVKDLLDEAELGVGPAQHLVERILRHPLPCHRGKGEIR